MAFNISKNEEMFVTLNLLQEAGFKSAVIAGGAIRDLKFGIIPRDIDIFLLDPRIGGGLREDSPVSIITDYDRDDVLADILNLRQNKLQYARDSIDRKAGKEYYKGHNHITSVVDVIKGCTPFQLIFLDKDPIEFVEDNFDFGLCKCYCDGNKIRYTPDFMRDLRDERLTLVAKNMSDAQYRSMVNHYRKLSEKFPKHKFRVAEHNRKIVELLGSP